MNLPILLVFVLLATFSFLDLDLRYAVLRGCRCRCWAVSLFYCFLQTDVATRYIWSLSTIGTSHMEYLYIIAFLLLSCSPSKNSDNNILNSKNYGRYIFAKGNTFYSGMKIDEYSTLPKIDPANMYGLYFHFADLTGNSLNLIRTLVTINSTIWPNGSLDTVKRIPIMQMNH